MGANAVLFQGRSGSGKSTLALEMLARGAALVADDRVWATLREGQIWLDPPEAIKGQIEARGVGILSAKTCSHSRLALVVDMDQTETQRLPEMRQSEVAGLQVPLLHKVESAHFPASLVQYLKGERLA